MAVGATYPGFLEAVKQARSQVQVRPKEDCITSTESFLEPGNELLVRQEVEKVRDACDFCRDQNSPKSGRTFAPLAPKGIKCAWEPT